MITIDSRPKLPKRYRPKPTPEPITNAMKAYRDAYKRVYGVFVEVTYDGAFIRIAGQGQGVSRKRLTEMTRQLNYRKVER